MADFNASLSRAKANLGIDFDLRDEQLQALCSLYEGTDTMVIVPTGFGKSVIFQLLPWIMQRKYNKPDPMIVIVVTPLNSIMCDQVKSLAQRGIQACYLDASGARVGTFERSVLDEDDDDDHESDNVATLITSVNLDDIRKGRYFLIYAHPETLTENKEIGRILRSGLYRERVCCTVVDEVHMISEWGMEFRKSFSKLGDLTCLFPHAAHLALTATATPESVNKLSSVLQFQDVKKIVSNPDRPNIYLEIRHRLPNVKKYEKYDEILQPLCEELGENLSEFPVTIVYCDNLESVGYSYRYVDNYLGEMQYIPKESKIPESRVFGQYHKDYTEKMKTLIISELQRKSPKLRLVFATVALGMGLNAPSIKRIIHYRPPTTLEKYLQEIGRAGRAGQEAQAIMYYNNSDIAANRKGLYPQVKLYAKNEDTCLRLHLVNYFGFHQVLYSGHLELCCSNCKKNARVST